MAKSSPRALRRTLTWLAALGCALCLVVGSALATPAPRPLTSDERQRLSQGELVTRPTIERRGSLRLVGGTSWQVINAKPGVVWRAVLDAAHYHRSLPRVKQAKVVQRSEGQRTIFLRHGVGFVDASYYLKVKLYPSRWDITFTLDDSRPHSVRAAWGFYSIRPYGRDKTLLAYGAMVDVGDGLMSSITRGTVQEWTLKVPRTMKRFVEGSGRFIYR